MEPMGKDVEAHRAPKHTANEALVFSAMAVVASALGIGAYYEAGLAAWLAGAIALGLFAVLAGVHLAVRRRAPVEAAGTDIGQLEAEIAKLNALSRGAATGPAAPVASGSPSQARRAGRAELPVPAGSTPGRGGFAAGNADLHRLTAPLPPLPDGREDRGDDPALFPARVEPGFASVGASARDNRQYRAAGLARDEAQTPTAGQTAHAATREPQLALARPGSGAEAVRGAAQTPREADVEMVQGLVRKLADQVSAAEANAGRGTSASQPPMDGAIEASLEALRATADTMRTASGLATSAEVKAPDNTWRQEPTASHSTEDLALRSSLPASGPGDPRIAALAEALSMGRADVLLEPILNLDDRRVRHYGISLRLKAASGESLDGEPGRGPGETAFGPAVDGLRLARTAQLAQRLAERGKLGFIFFDVGASALGSDRFVAEFAALYQAPSAWVRQLVPVFTQADLALFTSREWDALREIGKAGLCFSLRAIRSLDVNLAVIKTWGFEFAEIDAAKYLAGLPGKGGTVFPAEATRHLVQAGLTPIVGGIDDDAMLGPIVAAGALLGRGPLFGAPRPVKAEALGDGRHAA